MKGEECEVSNRCFSVAVMRRSVGRAAVECMSEPAAMPSRLFSADIAKTVVAWALCEQRDMPPIAEACAGCPRIVGPGYP